MRKTAFIVENSEGVRVFLWPIFAMIDYSFLSFIVRMVCFLRGNEAYKLNFYFIFYFFNVR